MGLIPVSDRLAEIRNLYEGLVDDSNITDDIPKDRLMSMLELLICTVSVISQ